MRNLHRTPSFIISLVIVICCLSTSAFLSIRQQYVLPTKKIISNHLAFGLKAQSRMYAKPDLFSDDLFEDGDDDNSKSEDLTTEVPAPRKKKYLDENWKLDAEDEKDFKGFPKKGNTEEKDPTAPPKKYPCFALMYKFRREYVDEPVDAMMADHKGHCKKFKRLINSEELSLGNSKGVVLLWAGFTETDKEETRAEIMTFLEDDPLLAKDAIEKWDIIDLNKTNKNTAADSNLPEEVTPST